MGDDVIKCQVPKAEGGMTRYQGHVTIVPVCLYALGHISINYNSMSCTEYTCKKLNIPG